MKGRWRILVCERSLGPAITYADGDALDGRPDFPAMDVAWVRHRCAGEIVHSDVLLRKISAAANAWPRRYNRATSCAALERLLSAVPKGFGAFRLEALAMIQPTPVGPVLVPLVSLTPAPWNPRKIKDERFQNLCRSLESDPDFLQLRPIPATADGTIFAGTLWY